MGREVGGMGYESHTVGSRGKSPVGGLGPRSSTTTTLQTVNLRYSCFAGQDCWNYTGLAR